MDSQPACSPGKWCCCYGMTCFACSNKRKTSSHDPIASFSVCLAARRKGKTVEKGPEARGMEDRMLENTIALQDFCKQQTVMATVRERKTDMEGSMFTTAARAGGGGRDSPALRSALSTPVGPQGWARLQLPTPMCFLGGGPILFMGRLLLLGSGDRVPNTSAASLRDARLTDKFSSQLLPGPFGKVEFPNKLIG